MTKNRSFLFAAYAGAFSASIFIAVGLVLRLFGIPTLAELFSDRFAPFLSIPIFFKMLSITGGYSHLKQIGYVSVLMGEIVALIVASSLARRFFDSTATRLRNAVFALALLGWLFCLFALWPNLGTNYRGSVPSSAVILNIAVLLAECALAASALVWSLTSWAAPDSTNLHDSNRRNLLAVGATAIAGIATVGILIRLYNLSAYSYDGTENAGEDLPPITPNDKFYTVTKNNVDPRPTEAVWGLKITGKVSQPRTLRLADIKAMPAVLQEVTLQCISNRIGGGLNSNAVWKGVPLRDILTAAGASADATQVTFRGADGFTDDVSFAKAMDTETLLVYEMNGDPLPLHHGFPARLIVPGYVGEKSVKWVTEIEVLGHDEKGFYEQQGWGPKFTLNNTSRFDAPDFSKPIALGSVVRLKGTAFAGDRAVRSVQISTDGEQTWRDADISYRNEKTAWVQWRFLWKPSATGDVMLAVRCIDDAGMIQSSEMKGPGPEPATGYHRVKATVKA